MNLLRTWFGPSKEEIWRQFCAQTGANLVEGGFWQGSKVEARHEEWTATLDTYTVSTGNSAATFTRMRAPYVNPDGFTFAICREGVFSTIGKWMGMQDVSVGYPEFDEAFIIKGNDDLLVVLEVVVGQFPGLAVFQPLLADLVAADVEVPNLPWDATELSWVDCLDYRLSR